ncbi:MAG: GIDE domain-containing protein [Acidobacteriota bacterium]
MWFFGLLLLAASGGLLYGHRSKQRKLGLIASTEVCTVDHLRQLAASMTEGLGPGSLHFGAAVSGTVRCDEPLTAELSGVPSVHYTMSVHREREEQREARSSGGETQTQQTSDQLTQQTQSVRFTLEDATGRLEVDPAGATFTAEQTISRLEPAADGGQSLRLGTFAMDVSNPPPTTEGRTVGYRFREQAIPVGHEVFILGEVTDPDGELRMARPADGQLLISVKNRDQLLREADSGSKFMRRAAIVCGVLGLLLLIL